MGEDGFMNRPADGQTSPSPWMWLVCLSVFALVLRIPGMNDGLWLDEIITLVESVRHPLARITTFFPGDNQHTLYSVLARISIDLLGEHPWTLRLPAVMMGVATVPMLYLFARELTDRKEALFSSALLAAAYHHVWFSQNARGYTTLTFLAVTSSWLLLRGLRFGGSRDWVLYGVVAALGVYTHVTMIFLIASQAIVCLGQLAATREAASLKKWKLPVLGFGLAGLLAFALHAPFLLAVREAVADPSTSTGGATTRWALLELVRGMNVGLGSIVGVLLAAVLFLAGLASYFKQSPWTLVLLLGPGVLTPAAAVVLERPVRPRFIFFLIGFALLILARGAEQAGRWIDRAVANHPRPRLESAVVIVAAMVVASVTAVIVEARYPKQDFDGPLRFLAAENHAGDPVAVTGGARYPYVVYYGRPWTALRSRADLDVLRAQGRPVWVVYTLKSYIADDLMRVLDEACVLGKVFPGTLRGGDVTVCRVPVEPALPSL